MLIAFNKPYGVLCQFTDRSQPPRPTLAGFGLPKDVYPAGRLDHDSEGLLLLTDDGGLAHRLTDPRHKQPKTYWVQVEGEPQPEQLQALAAGVVLNDGPTRPAGVRRLEPARAADDRCGGAADLAPGPGRGRPPAAGGGGWHALVAGHLARGGIPIGVHP